MESCECGMDRKKFWLWRDSNGEMHASRFPPTQGAVGSVIAATARDALLSGTNGNKPKHYVRDADNPGLIWEGRCKATA
jgi:hypothetical protein